MDIGQVERIDINDEMRSAYLDYAMSVIVARALPDARDGLKPVHRRILYAMHDMGIRANSTYKKSARIVGEVLGKYHPHSDTAVYDSMARMAQEFSLRYPLVDGQGNFGSIGGAPPAAMRYTEAKMDRLAGEMLVDIDKETVKFTDNFDASLQEPSVLPSRLPNLLLNGSSGIAVGMASNVPPHNLTELAGAINYIIDNYDGIDEVSADDLMKFVTGPDFPTGGIIVGTEGIRNIYNSGRGKLTVRGRAIIEEMGKDRHRIVISEIPYQVNLTNLIERIAEMARGGRLDGVSDLRDESDRTGMNIIIEMRRGAQPLTVLNRLYKYTPLQTTFSARVLALVNNEPLTLNLKRSLSIFIEHRVEVITRRTQFDLRKAKARSHILEGLLIALANLDDVIETIRKSDDVDQARERLVSQFKLTEIQAQAILDMQLRRLAALEQQKIQDEHKQVQEIISHLEDLLANPKKILALIKEDMVELEKAYGDERRTEIEINELGEFNEEDLVKDEAVFISITQRGYIKRVVAEAFRAQGRGGKGVKGHATKEEDEVNIFMPARTKETILFFSNRGKVYSEKTYRIPEASRTAKGSSIFNLLNLEPEETITAALRVKDFKNSEYCILATRNGKTKRVALSEFSSVRPSGLIAMNLNDDDELGWVQLTSGEDEIIFVSENGQALRFKEDSVRAMGRQAAGVKGINLRGDDKVTSMEVLREGYDLLIITTNGYGKRTPLDQYNAKGRATMGVKTIDTNAIHIVGKIAGAKVVKPSDNLTIISSNGVVLRTKVEDIKQAGRATRGVKVINLGEGDSVASTARMAEESIEDITEESNEEDSDAKEKDANDLKE
ncbi:MAG: DNA gyrase subunit A [Chloroflexi bacterium]|nr:DNA gyrase subunit A [Chloroflexota bacterium]